MLTQRLSLLFEFAPPDFYERSTFASYIDTLLETGLVREDADGAACACTRTRARGSAIVERLLPGGRRARHPARGCAAGAIDSAAPTTSPDGTNDRCERLPAVPQPGREPVDRQVDRALRALVGLPARDAAAAARPAGG